MTPQGVLQLQGQKSTCKDCGGTCKDCGSLFTCKDCGGVGICEHNRIRRHCRDCGGQGMCAHSRVCVECLIGKQKKPILFKVTEPSSVPYRAPSACAKRVA